MGYIIDFDQAAPAVRRPSRKTQCPAIADLTPIVPRAVAEAVHEEASVWLRTELPSAWITELAAKADTVVAHNRQFRRLIQQQGDAGRDWLWAFMRHWLSALIKKHSRQLHSRLPSAYAAGRTLLRE